MELIRKVKEKEFNERSILNVTPGSGQDGQPSLLETREKSRNGNLDNSRLVHSSVNKSQVSVKFDVNNF